MISSSYAWPVGGTYILVLFALQTYSIVPQYIVSQVISVIILASKLWNFKFKTNTTDFFLFLNILQHRTKHSPSIRIQTPHSL